MQANSPHLAGFDWRRFAADVSRRRAAESLSVRDLACQTGLTAKDVSHACGGHVVGVAKAIALSRWLGKPLDHWFLEPVTFDTKSRCYGRPNVKQGGSAKPEAGA